MSRKKNIERVKTMSQAKRYATLQALTERENGKHIHDSLERMQAETPYDESFERKAGR